MRFFQLEDFMIKLNYQELIHVEADNMIYGQMTELLPTLRTGNDFIYILIYRYEQICK
jgi:hypothetical protein